MNTPVFQRNPHPPVAHQVFALKSLGIPHIICPLTGVTTAQAKTTSNVDLVITGK
jgi:hypothetical protein